MIETKVQKSERMSKRWRDSHRQRKENNILIILRGTNRTVIFYCINLRRTKKKKRWRRWRKKNMKNKSLNGYTYTVVETRAGYYCILQRSASLSHLKEKKRTKKKEGKREKGEKKRKGRRKRTRSYAIACARLGRVSLFEDWVSRQLPLYVRTASRKLSRGQITKGASVIIKEEKLLKELNRRIKTTPSVRSILSFKRNTRRFSGQSWSPSV